MNFNLISPAGKASEYRINFKDPITIKPNSKLELNWAELSRKGEIVLQKAGSIDFVATKCLPNLLPSDSSVNDINFKVTVPNGVYELSEFQDFIESAITNDLPDKLATYQAQPVEGNNTGASGLQNDGEIGLVDDVTELGPVELDAVDEHDSKSTTTGGEIVAYTTHNNTGTYDNYANSVQHFDFYRALPSRSELEFGGVALAESIETIDNQVGKIGFGLTGLEYARGIAPAPTRTNGNNPPVIQDGVPTNFIWVECGPAGGDLIIYMAGNNAGAGQLNGWDDQNKEITDMNVIHRMPIEVAFDTTDKCKIKFVMSLDDPFTESPSFRFQVFNNQGAGDGTLLFDSKPDRTNLPFKLLIGDNTNYNNAIAINSQIPFGWQFSAQNQNQGWKRFTYAKFDKDEGTLGDAKPRTYMRSYIMTFSDELAEVLDIGNNGITPTLFPNVSPIDATSESILFAELDLNWKARNYSVFINLPCNNYKNVENENKGGFKKSILANLPSPFTTGSIIANSGTDVGKVISIYQPYQPIVSDLENNEITTNSIEIKIVDMKDETLATHLLSSILNFTIRQ